MNLSSAVLTTSLLLASLDGCREAPTSSVADLAGTWANEDAATQGITQLKVHVDSGIVHLDAWGACQPSDCYWGTAVADTQDWRSRRELHVAWDPGFARQTQVLTQLAAGRVRLVTSTHFVDNSGRPDYELTEYFRK